MLSWGIPLPRRSQATRADAAIIARDVLVSTAPTCAASSRRRRRAAPVPQRRPLRHRGAQPPHGTRHGLLTRLPLLPLEMRCGPLAIPRRYGGTSPPVAMEAERSHVSESPNGGTTESGQSCLCACNLADASLGNDRYPPISSNCTPQLWCPLWVGSCLSPSCRPRRARAGANGQHRT